MPLKTSGTVQARCFVCGGAGIALAALQMGRAVERAGSHGRCAAGGGKSDLQPRETQVTKKKPRSLLCVQQQRLLPRGEMQV